MSDAKRKLKIVPNASEFWRTQGHHFDGFTQALSEFIDNSIANFAAHDGLMDRTVSVVIADAGDDHVSVRLEDTGSGIHDFEVALRFADTSEQDGEPSEHGVGMKHALAYLNPSNDAWRVGTRTQEDVDANRWRSVSAPYDFELDEFTSHDAEAWPGLALGGTGTVVEFTCPFSTFSTVTRGTGGQVTQFSTALRYLKEDVSYIYAGLLSGQMNIRVVADGQTHFISALEPKVQVTVDPGNNIVEAPWNPNLKISYNFMKVHEHPDTIRRYKATMSTSGVQLRLNGRVIEDNIFSEIWGIEKHNSYNGFLGIVDLRSSDKESRPKTLSTKNGFRRDDPGVVALFQWIKNTLQKPPKESYRSTDETELRNDLKQILESSATSTDPTANAQKEVAVYTSRSDAPPRVDLVFFDGHKRVLIECKVSATRILDVYQLLMEWDGDIEDGSTPDQAWLIADKHHDGIKKVVETINQRKDANGKNYDIRLRTWSEWMPDRAQAGV